MFRKKNSVRDSEECSDHFVFVYVPVSSGGVVISCVDQVPLMGALFETSSAIGTVGLSLV